MTSVFIEVTNIKQAKQKKAASVVFERIAIGCLEQVPQHDHRVFMIRKRKAFLCMTHFKAGRPIRSNPWHGVLNDLNRITNFFIQETYMDVTCCSLAYLVEPRKLQSLPL